MRKILFLFVFTFTLITFSQTQSKVKVHDGVEIGGIQQWIGAKSDDGKKPLLLFLHGGPGFSSRSYSKRFIKFLKKDFIVAQWDQRGTGITRAWNPTEDSVSVALIQSDTREVVDYLLNRFKKDKLFLVGYSWGGILGLEYAKNHPENLHAYISVSSMINGHESERETLEILKKQAVDANYQEAIVELSEIEIPFTSWEHLYLQRKWISYFTDANSPNKAIPKNLFENWSTKWMEVFQEALSINHSVSISNLDCPIYFFLSENDLIANYKISERFYNDLVADKKEILWFHNSAHTIPVQEPKKFSLELIRIGSVVD